MAYPQLKLRLSPAVVGCLLLYSQVLTLHAQQPCAADSSALTYLVVDRTSRIPLTGALVSASWLGVKDRVFRTDSTGRARLCVPQHSAVTLRARYHEHTTPAPITLTPSAAVTVHHAFIEVPGVFVRGRVVDQQTGQPITQVLVRMPGTSISALTDGDGRFQFQRIPQGDYELRAEHISYAGSSTVLSLEKDDVDALVWLAPAAIALQPIVVTAFSRRLEHVGFYERQRRGVGTFISRKQIDAMSVHHASDLLRSVPSLRLIPQPRRANNQVRGRRGNCRFTYIVDGARTLTDFEMDNIAAYAIEGVELYNGLAEVPAVFRAHAASDGGSVTVCGVIAIWTRNSR